MSENNPDVFELAFALMLARSDLSVWSRAELLCRNTGDLEMATKLNSIVVWIELRIEQLEEEQKRLMH